MQNAQPFAVQIKTWAESLGISQATAYRTLEGEDPPPTVKINRRRRIAVGSAEYDDWLKRRMSAA